MIAFPHLFPFSETVHRLGLCNHFEDNRGAEGEVLSECSFTTVIANKASVGPVLNHSYVTAHLKSPDSPAPGHILGILSVGWMLTSSAL